LPGFIRSDRGYRGWNCHLGAAAVDFDRLIPFNGFSLFDPAREGLAGFWNLIAGFVFDMPPDWTLSSRHNQSLPDVLPLVFSVSAQRYQKLWLIIRRSQLV
jgi:hypothetical protein